MHTLVLGQSQCGKSVLLKLIARRLRAQGRTVLVFDPLFSEYACSERFGTIEEFSAAARATQNAHLIVDESGIAFAEGGDRSHAWLATTSRHWGHSTYFAAQRLVQVPPTVRDQCNALFLFTSSRKDGETHADEWNCEALRECNSLRQFECMRVDRYGSLDRLVIVGRKDVRHVSGGPGRDPDRPRRSGRDAHRSGEVDSGAGNE